MRSGRNGMNLKKQYGAGLLGLALLIVVMVGPALAQIRVESDKQEPVKHEPTLAPLVDKPDSTVANPVAAVSDSSTAPLPEDSSSIKPVPDTADGTNPTGVTNGPVKLEVASFNGVTPGETTAEELETKWGKSKAEKTVDQYKVYNYSIGPFSPVWKSRSIWPAKRSLRLLSGWRSRFRPKIWSPNCNYRGSGRSWFPTNLEIFWDNRFPSGAFCSHLKKITNRISRQ